MTGYPDDVPGYSLYRWGLFGESGAWGPGALLRMGGHEKELSGAEANTTNNRMEMMAAIEGLKALKKPCTVDIYTDSQYVRQGITTWILGWKKNGWKTADKKPVKNEDLWRILDELTQAHQVQWHWVKGHSGHPENDRVDLLARSSILSLKS